ncbi:hypothetical protein CC1G_10945 [Coprinopsis cinerea okayama7|uniref:Arrestin-like N-terminal domain-containing protein n=1 Tax=Coprinopsis cinerea (strain Okayama-7 / 130 / ATCC MYA-4618 / FGSC 9003) TaxID=240176 RepID=A8NT59_COPC7|nr:hypothetical protein CC1G_10945 [Coprinopsis cinerea okayama7\|eukprot:XP_001836164.2 hypothetical protein CC1G_10945 [Coprinopsis cinerea okayama7\
MDVLAPPPCYRRYSRGQAPHTTDLLPAYSRRHRDNREASSSRREPTEHTFELTDSKSKPWCTLKLYSSAKSSKSLPTFFEKEKITGKLDLVAERGDSIQAVTATVTGSIISGASSSESFVFLNQTLPIWSKCLDIPRVPSPSEGASSSKLIGRCEWPLSIPLPRTVDIPTASGDVRTYRLPETFLERYTSVSIQYNLTIVISRGKLRSDNVIKTAFGYVPSTRPEPPSLLRQLAYQENLPLPDPATDPEGWKTLRPVSVRGFMFKTRPVEARCTLSISRPLCYTRGSVLPCFLTLEGREPSILDVLAFPNAPTLKLRRRVRFFNRNASSAASSGKLKEVAWNESVDDVGTAVWWQPPNARGDESEYVRHLEGEIKLTKDLRPSSEIAHFSVSYSVVLLPFKAANYTSDSTPLLSEPRMTAQHHDHQLLARSTSPMDFSAP